MTLLSDLCEAVQKRESSKVLTEPEVLNVSLFAGVVLEPMAVMYLNIFGRSSDFFSSVDIFLVE